MNVQVDGLLSMDPGMWNSASLGPVRNHGLCQLVRERASPALGEHPWSC